MFALEFTARMTPPIISMFVLSVAVPVLLVHGALLENCSVPFATASWRRAVLLFTKVSVFAALADALADSVKVVGPVTAAMVAPAGMPVPLTLMPAARPLVLPVVTFVLAFVVVKVVAMFVLLTTQAPVPVLKA